MSDTLPVSSMLRLRELALRNAIPGLGNIELRELFEARRREIRERLTRMAALRRTGTVHREGDGSYIMVMHPSQAFDLVWEEPRETWRKLWREVRMARQGRVDVPFQSYRIEARGLRFTLREQAVLREIPHPAIAIGLGANRALFEESFFLRAIPSHPEDQARAPRCAGNDWHRLTKAEQRRQLRVKGPRTFRGSRTW